MISWVRGHRKILWRLLGGGHCGWGYHHPLSQCRFKHFKIFDSPRCYSIFSTFRIQFDYYSYCRRAGCRVQPVILGTSTNI